MFSQEMCHNLNCLVKNGLANEFLFRQCFLTGMLIKVNYIGIS